MGFLIAFALLLSSCAYETPVERSIYDLSPAEIQARLDGYAKALENNPEDADVYHRRAHLYDVLRQYSRAIEDYTRGIELGAAPFEAYRSRSRAYSLLGDYENALRDHNKVIILKPFSELAHYRRGQLLIKLGRYDRAVRDLTQATRLGLRYDGVHIARGFAYWKLGEYREAIADYYLAIEIAPGAFSAYNHLAWLLATCPDPAYRDGTRAVEMAQKATGMEPNCMTINTLAAAYAEAGEFQSAIDAQEKAIGLLEQESAQASPPHNKHLSLSQFVEDLEGFRSGTPIQDP